MIKPALEYDARGSGRLKDVIHDAKSWAVHYRTSVFFVFNGITLFVTPECSEEDALSDYDNAAKGRSAGYVRRANLAGCEYWPDTYERQRSAWEDLV